MTPEHLLLPRFKVIADYPFNAYNVGDVIELNSTMKNFLVAETGQYAHFSPISELGRMPHLFRLLLWAEERNTEDLPKYVKWESDDKVVKVIGWNKDGFCRIEGQRYYTQCSYFLPATLAEYEAYQKTAT